MILITQTIKAHRPLPDPWLWPTLAEWIPLDCASPLLWRVEGDGVDHEVMPQLP